MNKIVKLLIGVMISIFIIGCGSGGDSGTSSSSSTNINTGNENTVDNGSSENVQTGVFSDSKVYGVKYTQGARSGTTNSNGEFSFDKNDETPISFSIGKVNLGSISSSSIENNQTIYPTDIVGVEKSETNNTKVVNMLRILQSLDSDGNPFNGIEIDSNTTNSLSNLSQDINIDQIDENDTTTLNTIVVQEANKTLLDRDYAIAHFEDTLRNEEDLNINTVPPMPPIMNSKIHYTNQNYKTVRIFGQKDAKVFIAGVDKNKTISSDNYVDINISDITLDKSYTFTTILQDTNERNSSESNITIVKDTISPILTINDINANENTSNTVVIADVNVTDSSPVYFTLTGTDASRFIIDKNTGKLRFKQSPDYEIKTSYSITIVATDLATNVSSTSITVNINPLNDEIPIFISNVFAVEENNTTIGSFSIQDNDLNQTQTFTYTILGGVDKDLFKITSDSLIFVSAPDFDNPSDLNKDNKYLVDINVSDGINSSVKTFTITVTPANDNAPIVTSSANINFNENAIISVLDMEHTDADDSKPGMVQYFTYSISGTDSSYFNINPSTGVLSFKTAPDYETKQSYSLTATVFDGKNHSTPQNINISINHLNDEVPSFTSSNNLSVNENFSGVAHTLTKNDHDLDESQTFTYSITGTDASYFTINSTSGEISFKTAPDYESKKNYSIIAMVNDGVNDSEAQNITISINHLNDEIPIITSEDTSINENEIIAMYVTSSDSDINETQTFIYSIDGGADASKFSITNDGNLTFISAPDYENPTSNSNTNNYVVALKVSDGVNISQTKTLIISVLHTNDEVPVIISEDTNVTENSINIMMLSKIDNDINQDDQVFIYSINGGADASDFNLTNDGNLTFKQGIDYDVPSDDNNDSIYEVSVQVSDGINLSSIKTLNIGVTPLNDISPIIIVSNSSTVMENYSDVVMDINHTDADRDQDQNFTYSLGGVDNNYFNIDETNGTLTFKNAPDYETKSVYNFVSSVSDGNFESNQSITLNIDHTNDETPIVQIVAGSISQNFTGHILTFTQSDADINETQTFTYDINGTDANDFDLNNTTGELSVESNVTRLSSYTFETEVSDGVNKSKATVYITFSEAMRAATTENQDYNVTAYVNINGSIEEIVFSEFVSYSQTLRDQAEVADIKSKIVSDPRNYVHTRLWNTGNSEGISFSESIRTSTTETQSYSVIITITKGSISDTYTYTEIVSYSQELRDQSEVNSIQSAMEALTNDTDALRAYTYTQQWNTGDNYRITFSESKRIPTAIDQEYTVTVTIVKGATSYSFTFTEIVPTTNITINFANGAKTLINDEYSADYNITDGGVFYKVGNKSSFVGTALSVDPSTLSSSVTDSSGLLTYIINNSGLSGFTSISTNNATDGSLTARYEITITGYNLYEILEALLGSINYSISNIDFTQFTDVNSSYIDFYVEYDSNTSYSLVALTNKTLEVDSDISKVVNKDSIVEVNELIVNEQETFTFDASQPKGDFLFVMDDSGSMSEEQSAAIEAIERTFSAAISKYNLDWKATTIGTENSSSYTTNVNNPAENNISILTTQLDIGLNGADERGLKKAYQYLNDGSISIRNSSSLTMINVTDESEHTTLSDLGNPNADLSNSYFVTNGIRVNSIIPTSYQNTSDIGYKMTLATGGDIANLYNYDSGYDQMMDLAVRYAVAKSSSVKLQYPALASSITVHVNGVKTTSWEYDSTQKAIVFEYSAMPNQDDNITVTYSHLDYSSMVASAKTEFDDLNSSVKRSYTNENVDVTFDPTNAKSPLLDQNQTYDVIVTFSKEGFSETSTFEETVEGVSNLYMVNSNIDWLEDNTTFTSQNHTHGSSSTLKMTFYVDKTVSYSVSSEGCYDKLQIQINGGTATSYCNGSSGSIDISNGDTVDFLYSKDGSYSSGNDEAIITIQ